MLLLENTDRIIQNTTKSMNDRQLSITGGTREERNDQDGRMKWFHGGRP